MATVFAVVNFYPLPRLLIIQHVFPNVSLHSKPPLARNCNSRTRGLVEIIFDPCSHGRRDRRSHHCLHKFVTLTTLTSQLREFISASANGREEGTGPSKHVLRP